MKINEEGNVTLTFIFSVILILLLFSFAIDFGLFFAKEQVQQNTLSIALDEQKGESSGFLYMSLDNPAEEISESICSSLRRNNMNGDIDIYVQEAMKGATYDSTILPDNKRALAICVLYTDTYNPVMLGRIIGDMPIATEGSMNLVWFCNEGINIWRPTVDSSGEYYIGAGATDLNEAYMHYHVDNNSDHLIKRTIESKSELPSKLEEQLINAILNSQGL